MSKRCWSPLADLLDGVSVLKVFVAVLQRRSGKKRQAKRIAQLGSLSLKAQMYKSKRGRARLGAYGHGNGRGCGHSNSVDVSSTSSILTLSIADSNLSIPSPPSTPPDPSVSPTAALNLHSSTESS